MFETLRFSARLTGFALVAGLGLAATAQAATLGTFTHNYGSGVGQVDPGGNDVLSSGFVTVSDQSSSRFSDSFDFSSLAYSSISDLALTLTYRGAGPTLSPGELWSVRIQGNDPGGRLDDLFVPMANVFSPQTITISLATDFLTVNAFVHSLATESLAFLFSEFTPGSDSFRLESATLTVNGVAAVPLPAAGFMLFGALAGLAALRRRKGALAV